MGPELQNEFCSQLLENRKRIWITEERDKTGVSWQRELLVVHYDNAGF